VRPRSFMLVFFSVHMCGALANLVARARSLVVDPDGAASVFTLVTDADSAVGGSTSASADPELEPLVDLSLFPNDQVRPRTLF
jgi:hypothetical protein